MDDRRFSLKLGGQDFPIRPLPWRINKILYPRLAAQATQYSQLSAGGVAELLSEPALRQMGENCYLALKTTNPDLSEEAFDQLPITPSEVADAQIVLMYATGLLTMGQAEAPDQAAPAAPGA